jgi:hypothetical protein
MNIETDSDLITEIDFTRTLEQMIGAGEYDLMNLSITSRRFPVVGDGKKKYRNKLFYFNRPISSEDAVAAMQREGFAPATHVHGLAFGATFPDEQRMYPIACLGSSPRVVFRRVVVCLYKDYAYRALFLCYWRVVWLNYWRFLGVQEVSKP